MDCIIFSDKNDLCEGMYVQTLTWLLEILNDLEKRGVISENSKIVFDVNAYAYDNIIPTYISPKQQFILSDLQQPVVINIKSYKSANHIDFNFNMQSYAIANKIWNKYFKMSSKILDEIAEFNYSTTLGIHFQGTDKTTEYGEANPITQDEFITIIKDFMKYNDYIETFFCCSDEGSFIARIREEFPEKNVIEYNQKRSNDASKALHKHTDIFNDITKPALVDMLTLSRCHKVLKTNSALSAFAKIINPELHLITCCAMKQPWFPTGVVDVYKSSDEDVNKILNRTLMGHLYQSC